MSLKSFFGFGYGSESPISTLDNSKIDYVPEDTLESTLATYGEIKNLGPDSRGGPDFISPEFLEGNNN